jgi:trk system potassium uptake protein TrkH
MDRIEQFSIIAPDIGNIFRYMSIATAVPLVVAVIYREWGDDLAHVSPSRSSFSPRIASCTVPGGARGAPSPPLRPSP